MTNEIIDSVLTARDDVREQIAALDERKTKTRKDLDERLKLTRQLASLEKQFRAFGQRGRDREQFGIERVAMLFHLWMDVEPERVKEARVFLAKHDPEQLHKHDTCVKDDAYQQGRLNLIRYNLEGVDEDFALEIMRRFFESIVDADGNLPDWAKRRFARKDAIPSL